MKLIANMLYKIYENWAPKESVEESEEFDKIEKEFIESLNKNQRKNFLDLEIFYMEIVKNHSILVIEFLLNNLITETCEK